MAGFHAAALAGCGLSLLAGLSDLTLVRSEVGATVLRSKDRAR